MFLWLELIRRLSSTNHRFYQHIITVCRVSCRAVGTKLLRSHWKVGWSFTCVATKTNWLIPTGLFSFRRRKKWRWGWPCFLSSQDYWAMENSRHLLLGHVWKPARSSRHGTHKFSVYVKWLGWLIMRSLIRLALVCLLNKSSLWVCGTTGGVLENCYDDFMVVASGWGTDVWLLNFLPLLCRMNVVI